MLNLFSRTYRLAVSMGLIFICLILSGKAAGEKLTVHDNYLRQYSIRKIDPSAKRDSSGGSPVFGFVEYENRTEEAVIDGKKFFAVRRVAKTAEGDTQKLNYYIDPDKKKLVRVENEIVSRENKLLRKTTDYYGNHFFRYPPNSFSMELLPYAALLTDLEPGVSIPFNALIVPELRTWGFLLSVDGEESVTVPAGTFECIRIKVKYNKESLPAFFKMVPGFLVSKLFPETLMWVEKDEPHTMIKMQGYLEGIASPELVHELVKVEKN